MLKWIVGILGVIVLLLAGTCVYGYRKLTEGGGVATVTVAATPEHVWRLFTDVDSIRAWQDSLTILEFSTDSVLVPGDTVRSRSRSDGGRVQHDMAWVLDRAEAPGLLVWSARDDSLGHEIIRRTDSLVVLGDSVRIVSRFTSPMLDSIRGSDSIGGLGQRLVGASGRMATGGMRLVAQMELDRLEARLGIP